MCPGEISWVTWDMSPWLVGREAQAWSPLALPRAQACLQARNPFLPWCPEPQNPMGASAEGQPHTEDLSPADTSWAVQTSMGSPRTRDAWPSRPQK